ncbi:MAG: serine/threonine protein kinase, partial [Cystobacterineae bacterium]|nr:serine/threonine protein kinase [Cystobacterineae bacterium]
MGEVHKATQLSLNRPVAVKLLSPELAKDASAVARFEREAAAMAALSHPHIVAILDKGSVEDSTEQTYYIVMEYIEGPSLREVLREPNFEPMAALKLFSQVCQAVAYAHGRGVIHRDLKPENILIDELSGNVPKVMDFGLAGLTKNGNVSPEYVNLTQSYMAMGTAAYMAPEQQSDARSADHRADIFSLGILLYEILIGDPPPRGLCSLPSEQNPSLDKRLDAIVSRCLQHEPNQRFASVEELIEAIEPLLPETPELRIGREGRRLQTQAKLKRIAWWGLAILSTLISLFAATIILGSFRRNQDNTPPLGIQLTTETGLRWPLAAQGRMESPGRRAVLGEGPDTLALVATGNKPALNEGEVLFKANSKISTGLLDLDVNTQGDGLEASAVVKLQEEQASAFEPLWSLLRGPKPANRSALMLTGESGRYVALILSSDGSPPILEWALGSEKRATLLAPLHLNSKTIPLSLYVEPESGLLSAFIGKGRDKRMLGEPVHLGPNWLSFFGQPPHLAVGCLQGPCTFSNLEIRALHLAPPPSDTPPLLSLLPEPAPPPANKNTAAKPAKTSPPPPTKKITPTSSTPPPPVKKTTKTTHTPPKSPKPPP